MNNLSHENDCDSSTESELCQDLENKIRTYSSGKLIKNKSQIDVKVADIEKIQKHRNFYNI